MLVRFATISVDYLEVIARLLFVWWPLSQSSLPFYPVLVLHCTLFTSCIAVLPERFCIPVVFPAFVGIIRQWGEWECIAPGFECVNLGLYFVFGVEVTTAVGISCLLVEFSYFLFQFVSIRAVCVIILGAQEVLSFSAFLNVYV